MIMKTKVMITGGSGFLGSRLAYYYRERYELLLPTHSELNVSREEAVRAYLELYRPDVVIHCAALSNTWYCEQHPEESHRVNVQGTVRLAKACKLTGAKLIFMSSDQVYNGTPLLGPLQENVILQPVNVYGRHKLEAEQRVLCNLPDAVGLRLTWMYDLPVDILKLDTSLNPSRSLKLNSNILVNLQKAAAEGMTLQAATHEYRGVTNVWEGVRNLEHAIALPGGIYNFGSGNTLDSYTLYLCIARAMGLANPSTLVLPDEERYSQQPRNLTMDCSLIGCYGIQFNDSLQGVKEVVAHPQRVI